MSEIDLNQLQPAVRSSDAYQQEMPPAGKARARRRRSPEPEPEAAETPDTPPHEVDSLI